MAYRLFADLVVIIHCCFILFAVLGGLLVRRRRYWAWLHLPAFLWAGLIELTRGICPLTPLENRLRALGGEEAYRGAFIDRYVMPILYPDELSQGYQIFLGSFVLVLNAAIYVTLWRRGRTKAG